MRKSILLILIIWGIPVLVLGLPDLLVKNYTITPTNPTICDLASFQAIIQNNSNEASGACKVEFKLGGESNPPIYDVPGLSPGEEYTLTRKYQFLSTGNFISKVTVDVLNQVAESSEINNTYTYQFQIGLPDLTVNNIFIDPASPLTSDLTTITVKIWNNTDGTWCPSKLELRVGGESSPPVYQVPELLPGEDFIIKRQIILQVAQQNTTQATIDIDNQISETDETNNVKQKIFSVAQGTKPDLSIVNFQHTPANPTIYDVIKVSFTLQNNTSAYCDDSKVKFQIGGEGDAPKMDVDIIPPHGETDISRTIQLNVAQNYMCTATADYYAQVVESNEGNNIQTHSFTVGRPDLTVESITLDPASPTTEDLITFTAVIKNNSSGTCCTSKVKFKVGGEGSSPKYNVPALSSMETYTVTRQLNLNVAQNYVATITADINDDVSEYNESNNVLDHVFSVAQGTTSISESDNHAPESYRLYQNHPNPFNASTRLSYDLADAGFVTLKIYDMRGREIQSLVNKMQPQGNYNIQMDLLDLPSGIYFYTLRVGNQYNATKKMVLIK